MASGVRLAQSYSRGSLEGTPKTLTIPWALPRERESRQRETEMETAAGENRWMMQCTHTLLHYLLHHVSFSF